MAVFRKIRNSHAESAVTYMEIYGVNRVIYRVTKSTVIRSGREKQVCGITLTDIRTGHTESIENFSESLDKTLHFANELIRRQIPPERLYNEALRHLRYSPESIMPLC